MSELPPAGWYDDPTSPGRERWWDGSQWSEQTRPKAVVEYQHRAGELRRVSDFLGHGFGLMRARWDDFLLIAALAAIVTSIAALVLIRPLVDAIDIVDNQVTGFEFSQFALLFVFSVVATIVYIVSLVTHYRIAWEAATDQPGSWSSTLLYGVANTPRVIGWGLLAMAPLLVALVVIIILIQVAPGFGAIGLAALFLGGAWWAMVVGFLPMAVIVQPPSTNPISAAFATVKGRWWRLFGRALLFGIIVGLGIQVVGAIFAQLVGANFFGIEFVDAGDGNFEIIKNLGSPLDFFVGSLASMLLSFVGNAGQSAAFASMAFDVMPRPGSTEPDELQSF